MSALSIQPTYPIFTDIDGQPLEAGYVWLGAANLDPQVNPINVYWDSALTIPAAQPIRTLGGYPSRNGTPARLYVNSDYSIRVQNRNGSTVYSAPAATERYGNIISASDIVYTPAGINAIPTDVQSFLRQSINAQNYASFADAVAVAALGTVKSVVVSSVVSGGGVTIPTDVLLIVERGGEVSVGTGQTFTINGSLLAGNYKIFDLTVDNVGNAFTGSVVFGSNSVPSVTPTWFGASNNSSFPYDTAAVQTAINTGLPVDFTANYTVDNVVLNQNYQTIRGNGFELFGGSDYGAAYVLAINCQYLKAYQLYVNQNFKNYQTAVKWFSNASRTAQFCNVYGLHISCADNGLTFGENISTPSYNAPQSENTVYGFLTRAVQVPYVGNQTNGFLTLVSPELDCAPYEWASQPGYNATTFNTNAYAFRNVEGNLLILGGEVLKTTSNLGYGMSGGNVSLIGTTIEVASTQAEILGDFSISSNLGGFMSGDSVPAFSFAASAAGAASGATLTLDDYTLKRGDGVQLYSGAYFINQNPSLEARVIFSNSRINNWSVDYLRDPASTNIKITTENLTITNFNGSGVLIKKSTVADTQSAYATPIASASTITPVNQIMTVSGTAAINNIDLPFPGFTGQITLIPSGAFTTTTSGNIAKASTAAVGQALIMTYDGSKWHPSY